MTSTLTQKWLRESVQTYPDQQRVYSDIDAVLARIQSLRPKSDVYTFDDGRTQLLLCVHGLLPITYRQATYNIPVAVWLPRDYPRQPPIVYVVPTNDMLVKPGRYLDPSGRCTVEYIQHWERKPEVSEIPPVASTLPTPPKACSLSALFEALQERFSHEPPVYSKPRPVSPPPLPVRPALQPAQPPPLPPHPPVSGLIGQTNPPANYPLRLSPPTVPPPPILAIPIPIVPPPPHPFPVPPSAPFTPHPSRPDPPRAPIPDLLDQDSVPSDILGPSPSFPAPPPRPPNPELVRLQAHVHQKLTSELNSLSQALALDAERLRAQQADLLAGEPAIKDEMARLEAVRDVCRSVANRTRQAVQQAEANIAELRRKGDPEVDELVCATSIVHNQLINLIADDNAIEDTIYHLHRALNAGRIDLERFLRATRVLAEEQFMKRALIEKIQNSVSTMPSSSIAPDWA